MASERVESQTETQQKTRTVATAAALAGLLGLLFVGTDAIWNQGVEIYHWAVLVVSGILIEVSRRKAMGVSV